MGGFNLPIQLASAQLSEIFKPVTGADRWTGGSRPPMTDKETYSLSPTSPNDGNCDGGPSSCNGGDDGAHGCRHWHRCPGRRYGCAGRHRRSRRAGPAEGGE